MRNTKGITLIALVITIIVLLILAGVSLSFIAGENGILGRATNAVDKNRKATAEEEANLAVADVRMGYYEEGAQGSVKEYMIQNLKEYETPNGKITCDETGNVKYEGNNGIITGTIDNDGNVIWGIVPMITGEVITEGIVSQGSSVEVRVKASITEGKVVIVEPEKASLVRKETDTDLEKVYVYMVSESGNYVFTADSEDGKSAKVTVKVNQIIDKPRVVISENKGIALVVSVENDYPVEAGIMYSYYLNGAEKASNITEKSYTIEELTENTEYTVKVVILYDGMSLESDELTIRTIEIPVPPATTMVSLEENPEKEAIEFPVLTANGVMNCVVKCKKDDKVKIEMRNKENVKNYYSVDGGQNWIEYIKTLELSYPGDGLLKAKSENELGSSEVKDIMPYCYDETINCTGPTTGQTMILAKEAYDRNYSTYANCDTLNGDNYCIDVDSECWGKYVTLYTINTDTSYHYGCIHCIDSLGNQLKGGYVEKLTGESIKKLTAKSIEIPKQTSMLYFFDGTDNNTPYYMYEVWCSDENLTGKIYH